MDIPSFYNYLTRARRDLWLALEEAPSEVLAEPRIPGTRFHCINDLLVHVVAVEDSWLHEDILQDDPVWETVPAVADAQDGPHYAAMPLADILDFWRAVEARTLAYLSGLEPSELARSVTLHDDDNAVLAVEDILWHVLQHEVRHTAQIALLLRQAGLTPPQFDLLFYLPLEKQET
ncbi:MAG: DinB family protein [Trueperaceae bacterium]